LAIATATLLALSATADAATSKYRYHSYEPSYEHKRPTGERYDHGHEAYAMRDYSHYDDQYYSREPSYESHYREPHHGNYDEGYGGDAYSENYEPSMKSRQMYKHKRSTDEMGVREDQVLVPLKKIKKLRKALKKKKVLKKVKRDEMGAREGQFFIKKLIFPFPEETSKGTTGTGTKGTTGTGRNKNKERKDIGDNNDDDDDDDDDEKFQPEGRLHKRSVQSRPTYKQTHEPRYKRSTLNREAFPGCFSSPPEDCGADCVASFREDEGCYQCCCMENPVNETTCALPADGGDGGRCRGNFERWAFNEATGDCEPFTYGGCGGNGNRFMCKEMCERHCVEEGGREEQASEGQASTCPLSIRVSTGFGWNNAIGVTAQLGGTDGRTRGIIPGGIYHIYTKGNRKVGSGEHWVSDIRPPGPGTPGTPTHAIWKDGSNWHIGTIDNLGTGLSLARIKSSKCPHNAGFGWKYFEPATDSWVEAGRGLVIREV